jgi:class 3 adenylate cyclase
MHIVETVGDSYVAVTGLPYPQKDHAVLMARFGKKENAEDLAFLPCERKSS